MEICIGTNQAGREQRCVPDYRPYSDEDTLRELHTMCVDEVRHINGVINFESAVKFQNE